MRDVQIRSTTRQENRFTFGSATSEDREAMIVCPPELNIEFSDENLIYRLDLTKVRRAAGKLFKKVFEAAPMLKEVKFSTMRQDFKA